MSRDALSSIPCLEPCRWLKSIARSCCCGDENGQHGKPKLMRSDSARLELIQQQHGWMAGLGRYKTTKCHLSESWNRHIIAQTAMHR